MRSSSCSVEFLLNLPLRYYAGFVRLARIRPLGPVVRPLVRATRSKGLAVEMVGAVLFLWVPYLDHGPEPEALVALRRAADAPLRRLLGLDRPDRDRPACSTTSGR